MFRQIKIFIYIAITSQIWTQISAKSPDTDRRLPKATCLSRDVCIPMFGPDSDCIDNACVCLDQSGCLKRSSRSLSKVNVVGGDCTHDEQCNISNSSCSDGKCTCSEEHIASPDKRKCLKISGGLAQQCEEDVQCLAKVQFSVCDNTNTCVCDELHTRSMFKCVPKVKLGTTCKREEECTHTKYARCGTMYCECIDDYVPSTSKDRCLPVANVSHSQCEEPSQCRELYGHGGICVRNECDCDTVHRVANRSGCPTRLKKPCQDSTECQSFSDDFSMQCEQGMCECAASYIEEDGYCNGAATIRLIVPVVAVLLHVLFISF